MALIFVYGTLRAGGVASPLLAGCRRLGSARLSGTLFDVGGRYPALVLDGDGPVHGELWRCSEEVLERLDDYEGVAEGLFRRVEVAVAGRRCWAYVAGAALEPRLRPEWRVPGGRWEPPGLRGSGGLD